MGPRDRNRQAHNPGDELVAAARSFAQQALELLRDHFRAGDRATSIRHSDRMPGCAHRAYAYVDQALGSGPPGPFGSGSTTSSLTAVAQG